jgi:hypothetical protein
MQRQTSRGGGGCRVIARQGSGADPLRGPGRRSGATSGPTVKSPVRVRGTGAGQAQPKHPRPGAGRGGILTGTGKLLEGVAVGPVYGTASVYRLDPACGQDAKEPLGTAVTASGGGLLLRVSALEGDVRA